MCAQGFSGTIIIFHSAYLVVLNVPSLVGYHRSLHDHCRGHNLELAHGLGSEILVRFTNQALIPRASGVPTKANTSDALGISA